MNNKERKGKKKSSRNEGFEIYHEICHVIHILTLLVNFTTYIRKADVDASRCWIMYQSKSVRISLHCILGSIPSIWHRAH